MKLQVLFFFTLKENQCDFAILSYVLEKGSLSLRTVGIKAYCAECGSGHDAYTSWLYFKDDVIHIFADGLDADEEPNVEAYLSIVNKTGQPELTKEKKRAYMLFLDQSLVDALKKWFAKNQKLLVKKKEVKVQKRKVLKVKKKK